MHSHDQLPSIKFILQVLQDGRLMLRWVRVLQPVDPRQPHQRLNLVLTEFAHFPPKLIHLRILQGIKFMKTYRNFVMI